MNQLAKTSNSDEIKEYFIAVLKLSQGNKEFPVNLDDVWPLVYSAKDKAVDTLKKNFVQSSDNQSFTQLSERQFFDYTVVKERVPAGHSISIKENYYLSVSCLEYFIARKNRDVFEVYRQVFHQTVVNKQSLSPAEILLHSAQLLYEQEQRMNTIEHKIDEVAQRTKTDVEYSTVVGYISRFGIKCDALKIPVYGGRASRICKKQGIIISKVNDPRWGSVNCYPDKILDEVFSPIK